MTNSIIFECQVRSHTLVGARENRSENYFQIISFQKETPSDIQLHLAAIRGDEVLLRKLLDSGRVHVDCKDEVSHLFLFFFLYSTIFLFFEMSTAHEMKKTEEKRKRKKEIEHCFRLSRLSYGSIASKLIFRKFSLLSIQMSN